MRFDSPRIITWYSATLGLAFAAVLYAYFGVGPVLPGGIVFSLACYASLMVSRKAEEENSPYHKTAEVIAAVGMVAFLPMIMLVDFIAALIIFLGFAQLALNFQTYDFRRFYLGMAVGFIGICVGAAESKSGFYLVFFAAYTVSAGITLGYAYMARRGNVETMQWDWTNRTAVSLLVLLLAIVIYLILPRFPAGGFLSQPGSEHFYQNKKWENEAEENPHIDTPKRIDRFKERQDSDRFDSTDDDGGAYDTGRLGEDQDAGNQGDFDYRGFRQEFDIIAPDEKGHRFSNRIVARMRADQPQYLRARIFDIFDGSHWHTSSDRTVKLSVGFNGVDLVDPEGYSSAALQNYEIHIEHNLGDYVPAAAVPVQLKFPATVIGVDFFGQIRSPGALKKGTSYAVTSRYNVFRNRRFAELDYLPSPSYTQLPAGADPRIEELAGEIIRGATSELAAAVALEQHLRTRYAYDLDSALTSQNDTPLSEFLFERKRGHCEFFASALAVMLRTQHIPTRLVTGFSATNRNPLTGYFDIYALDGHAWVEAYVDGEGWVILEPTAYYDGPLPLEEGLSVEQINAYVERQVRLRDALGRNELTLTALVNAVWQLLYVIICAVLGYVKLFILRFWYWLAIALLVVINARLAWYKYKDQWTAYRICRKVSGYEADQPKAAMDFYLSSIAALLKLAGFNPSSGQTIERYLADIDAIGKVHGHSELADIFNRIHYNNEPLVNTRAENYKKLFQGLYALGFHNLRMIAASHHRQVKKVRGIS